VKKDPFKRVRAFSKVSATSGKGGLERAADTLRGGDTTGDQKTYATSNTVTELLNQSSRLNAGGALSIKMEERY